MQVHVSEACASAGFVIFVCMGNLARAHTDENMSAPEGGAHGLLHIL